MESCSTRTSISLVPNLPKHQPQAKQILKLPNIKGENKFTRIFCQSLYSRKYPEVFVPYFPCSVLNDDRFSLLKRDRFFHVYMWRSFGGIIISPPRASCPKCTCNPRLTIITRRSFGEMAPGCQHRMTGAHARPHLAGKQAWFALVILKEIRAKAQRGTVMTMNSTSTYTRMTTTLPQNEVKSSRG